MSGLFFKSKFQGISPQNMVLYGTNVPPFQDPEIPLEKVGTKNNCSRYRQPKYRVVRKEKPTWKYAHFNTNIGDTDIKQQTSKS